MTSERDPDAFFAAHGLKLILAERNLDATLPRSAPSRRSTHWADLVAIDTGAVVAESYGSGRTPQDAKRRAVERWLAEQGA